MKRIALITRLAAAALLATGGLAQAQTTTTAPAVTPASTVQRDVNQQQRIENGLQSGRITTREAGILEREEAHVDRLQAQDLKKGPLTAAEQRQLQRAQNHVSRDIHTAASHGVTGNPLSASSQRLQADVQRNVNQEKRIENGVQTGTLNNAQTARLEAGQAHVDRMEARAAHDGHVGAAEQRAIQREENHQSRRIHKAKTGGQG